MIRCDLYGTSNEAYMTVIDWAFGHPRKINVFHYDTLLWMHLTGMEIVETKCINTKPERVSYYNGYGVKQIFHTALISACGVKANYFDLDNDFAPYMYLAKQHLYNYTFTIQTFFWITQTTQQTKWQCVASKLICEVIQSRNINNKLPYHMMTTLEVPDISTIIAVQKSQ